MTSDLTVLDKLLCDIIVTNCRHITHTGKNGLPSKRDYCYSEKRKKIVEECTKEKDVYKMRPVCKRRKPQPLRVEGAIHKDPHKKSFWQLTFESNDGYFNGADPFSILLGLGNADTKAIIPSSFLKCPRILPSNDGLTLKLQFFHLDNDEAADYILKYATKGPIPMKHDDDIMKEVLVRKAHESTTNRNSDNRFTCQVVNAMYKQSAIQMSVCSFNAQHVIMGIPQTFKNYDVTSYNCLGRKTIKKNSDQSINTHSITEYDLYNKTVIEQFDQRANITQKNKDTLPEPFKSLITDPQSRMSLRQFFDIFKITSDKNTGKYKVTLCNRVYDQRYKAVRFVPHTTMREANPNNHKLFPIFCQKMCLTNGIYNNITAEVRSDLQALGLPSGNKENDSNIIKN